MDTEQFNNMIDNYNTEEAYDRHKKCVEDYKNIGDLRKAMLKKNIEYSKEEYNDYAYYQNDDLISLIGDLDLHELTEAIYYYRMKKIKDYEYATKHKKIIPKSNIKIKVFTEEKKEKKNNEIQIANKPAIKKERKKRLTKAEKIDNDFNNLLKMNKTELEDKLTNDLNYQQNIEHCNTKQKLIYAICKVKDIAFMNNKNYYNIYLSKYVNYYDADIAVETWAESQHYKYDDPECDTYY
jgi:hypothetical protein